MNLSRPPSCEKKDGTTRKGKVEKGDKPRNGTDVCSRKGSIPYLLTNHNERRRERWNERKGHGDCSHLLLDFGVRPCRNRTVKASGQGTRVTSLRSSAVVPRL